MKAKKIKRCSRPFLTLTDLEMLYTDGLPTLFTKFDEAGMDMPVGIATLVVFPLQIRNLLLMDRGKNEEDEALMDTTEQDFIELIWGHLSLTGYVVDEAKNPLIGISDLLSN